MAEQPEPREPYVFLSYTTPDRTRVLALADRLETAGLRAWVDRREIAGGSSWDAAIVEAIRNCTVFVVLCSEAAMVSPNVLQEVRLAQQNRKPVLPLLLEVVTYPPALDYALAGRQWVELLGRPEEAWLPDVLRALHGESSAWSVVSRGDHAARGGVQGSEATTHDARLTTHPSTNLPAPRTSFVGRERELAELTALLTTTGLLTLTGPGGTGKTRLAIAAARQVAGRFVDGVWFVDLAGVADPAGVIPAIAQALEVRESEGRSLTVSLAAYLRRKQLLIVLDNFEQVIEAAMTVYDLLVEAPGLVLLVTSRVLLHVESEREYVVPPLPLPGAGAADVPEQLGAIPAVQLFVDRAQALRAGFRLSNDNAAAVAGICRRLDGLPLAIELAAARVKLLPPVQLLARLEQRLAFLTGGERNRPLRHQTLRNTIQWSWDLLATAEQVLFRRLTVFAGGFTLTAAEAVCNAGGELDLLDGLAALVDQSLVRQSEQEGEPRLHMLATLQEFALEQLETATEGDALRRVHATYYATLAEQAVTTYWRSGRMQQDLLRPLDPERENLMAALAWALAEQDAAVGLRLAGGLGLWLYFRAPGEGQQWLERLLSLPAAATPSSERGRALNLAGSCAHARGELQAAVAYEEAAAACLRAAEDLPFLSNALGCLGLFLPAAEADRAQAVAEEAVSLARAAGGTHMLALAEGFAGQALLWHGGNVAVARGHLEEALRLARALDADWLTMYTLIVLAALVREEGQHAEARSLLYEALPLAEALGDRNGAAINHMGLAAVAGDPDEAATHWRRGLVLAQELGSVPATAPCLAGIAGLLSGRQRFEPAVRLLGASDRLRDAAEQDTVWGPQFLAAFTPALSATQAALRPEVFALAWAAGQALSLDQATDLALVELASMSLPTNAASPAGA